MKKLIALVLMFASLAFAGGFYNQGTTKGYMVELSSSKTLVEGNNALMIKIMKDGKAVTNAMVKVKFFMPEMPGMPYMEYKADGKKMGDMYKAMVNFGMGGTWQYHLLFKVDGKKYKYRGSVNLGQSMDASMMKHDSMMHHNMDMGNMGEGN